MSAPQPETTLARAGRSADDIRDWIVGELAKSMNVHSSSIDTAAPLDSLGVDSLAAIGMTGALAGWLQRDLPTTLMWDYTSIDAICGGLADPNAPVRASAPRGAVVLQSKGDGRPVFFFPGLRGYAATFASLAAQLGADQPCYVLNIPGFESGEQPAVNVESAAAAMLENMRRIQPFGPYQLAGYSFGGLLAFEAARQLAKAGETVSLLAIYDTFAPSARIFRPRWQRLFVHAWLLAARPGRRKYLRERWERLTGNRRGRTGESTRDVGADPGEARAKAAVSVNYQSALKYVPQCYGGSMVLFRAMQHDADDIFYKTKRDNGWGALVKGGLRIIDLPGSHLRFLRPEHAAEAAEKLKPFLAASHER